MIELEKKIQSAERLDEISMKVGFAVWQIQLLEQVSATCYVMLCQAEKGMGEEPGRALEDAAKSKTFGSTVSKLGKAGVLEEGLLGRLRSLLEERNWLVHRSRADSNQAVYCDEEFSKLQNRLVRIAEEAALLISEIGQVGQRFIESHGFSIEDIR